MACVERDRPDGMESLSERTKEIRLTVKPSDGKLNYTVQHRPEKNSSLLASDTNRPLLVKGNGMNPDSGSGLAAPTRQPKSNLNHNDNDGTRDQVDSGFPESRTTTQTGTENTSRQPQEHGSVSSASVERPEDPSEKSLPCPTQESTDDDPSARKNLGYQDTLKNEGYLVKDTITWKDYNFLETLGQKLDPARLAIKNWKNLAQVLGVPHDVSRKFDFYTHTSPTGDLFEYLQIAHADLTVRELQTKLRALHRNDLVLMLNDFVGFRVFNMFIDYPQVRTNLESELDIDSRVLGTWRSLAGQFGLPKSKVDQFGKCIHGPTEELFDYLEFSGKKEHRALKVKELKAHLGEMQRRDVLLLLDQYDDSSLVRDALQPGSNLLGEVCQKLDKDVRALKGWQNLACRLGIPSPVYKQFDRSKQRERPTELLFQSLANTRPDLTIDELLEALKTIGRNDVVELVKEHREKALKKQIAGMDSTDSGTTTQIVEGLDKMAKETKGKGLRALDDLIKNAHRRGFELQRDCPGDGSCMFHALSDQVARLGIGSIGPLDMREILVQYLEDNPKLEDGTQLVRFVHDHERWSDYLKNMRRETTWGDHIVLLAAANHFHRTILIITSSPHDKESLIKPAAQTSGQLEVNDPMVLGHVAEYHYVSLQPRQGRSASVRTQEEVPRAQNVTSTHMGNGPQYTLPGAQRVAPQRTPRRSIPMSKEARLHMSPTQMPLEPVYIKICRMLDYKRAFYDDFRMLAEKLGMDRDDIRWLEQQNDPTNKILDAMKRTLTVGCLIDVLRELEREDVASELEAWVNS